MKNLLLLLGLLTAPLFLSSCQDALEDVKVQDAATTADTKKAVSYAAVNIDLLRVEVTGDTDENTGNWTALTDVTPGLRNLLQTGNTATPLVSSATFGTGDVKQLRVFLGPNSHVILSDGRIVPMDTPSGQQSGLKVKVNGTSVAGRRYNVLVPIDPDWQVVPQGNGQFNLKPVLRGTLAAAGGIIILPPNDGGRL